MFEISYLRRLILACLGRGVVERWLRSAFSIVREENFCGKWGCGLSCRSFGERDDRIFRGPERLPGDVWSLVICFVSL